MAYIISIFTSVVSAMLIFVLQSFVRENKELKQEKEKKQAERENALEDGVVCLLRVKLIEYHGKYTGRQEISSNGYENWDLMFKAYKKLGGNGMIDHMREEIEELHFETNKNG